MIQTSDKKSILIGLIHNNNSKRNELIFSSINELTNYLSKFFFVSNTKISSQSKLIFLSSLFSFLREMYYLFFYENKLNKYRLLKSKTLIHKLKFTRYAITRYLKNQFSYREKKKRITAIEINLTDKHIRLLDQFIESGKDYLVVLEDDAILNVNSFSKILNVINLSIDNVDNTFFCIDLAGGTPFSDLKLDKIIKEKLEDIIFLKKPIINTLCACIFNRNLVLRIKEKLLVKPLYRYIPADHMINNILFEIYHAKNSNSTFIHYDPPAIEHGSYTQKFGDNSTVDEYQLR